MKRKPAAYAERWGYVDTTGQEVIPQRFTGAGEMSDGLAFVSEGSDTRVIRRDGTLLRGKWQYHRGSFSRGRGCVSMSDRYGYIDRDGRLVVPARFDGAEPFVGPLANVTVGGRHRWLTLDGNLVGEPFDHTHGFSDDRAWVHAGVAWGCVDASGHEVVPPTYYDCRPFSSGLAAVKRSAAAKWEYIDTRGSLAIDARFDEAHPFRDERAIVKRDRRYRLIDPRGKPVGRPFPAFSPTLLAPSGTTSGGFCEGLLGIIVERKLGFIDRAGKVAIRPRFRAAFGFADGHCAVSLLRRGAGELWGLIDRRGDFTIEPRFGELHPLSDGRCAVKDGHGWGYVDARGTMIVPARHLQVQRTFREGMAWVRD